jgi:hypothetical protein
MTIINTIPLEGGMQHILDHPEAHNQGVYIEETTCGTAACLAGWIGLLYGEEYGFVRGVKGDYFRYIGEEPVVMCNIVSDESGWWEDSWTINPGQSAHASCVASHIIGVNDKWTLDRLFDGSNTVDMLQLMVKDLANGGQLEGGGSYYRQEAQK